MDDVTVLKRQLERAADLAGDVFEPPAVADFVRRRRTRRRTDWSIAAAVTAVVAVVVSIGAVHLARRPDRPTAVTGATTAALANDKWTVLPKAPIQGRDNAAAVWTGTQMIIWGGNYPGQVIDPVDDGAAYNPATRKWTLLPPSPLQARSSAASVWTGHDVFIWGGAESGESTLATDGALYDPAAHRWTMLPAAPVSEVWQAQAWWTGSQVILLTTPQGATVNLPGGTPTLVHADAYDPATNRWTALPDLNLPTDQSMVQMVTLLAGPQIYVWSKWTAFTNQQTTSGIGAYVLTPGQGGWTKTDPTIAQAGSGNPLWNGHQIVVPEVGSWCYGCFGGLVTPGYTPGQTIDPTTGASQPLPPDPLSGLRPGYLWTGAALLAYNTGTLTASATTVDYPGEAAVWDPATDRWTRLPAAPLSSEDGAAVVWTGDRLLIWGLLDKFAHDGSLSHGPTSTTETAGLQFGP